jgi:hypothetical protein
MTPPPDDTTGAVPLWVLWGTPLIGLVVVAGVCLGIPAATGLWNPRAFPPLAVLWVAAVAVFGLLIWTATLRRW